MVTWLLIGSQVGKRPKKGPICPSPVVALGHEMHLPVIAKATLNVYW